MKSRRTFSLLSLAGLFLISSSAQSLANQAFYIREDGNDANTGLANTPADAWATLQHANDFISTLALGNDQVAVTVEPGSYAGMGCMQPYTSSAFDAVVYAGAPTGGVNIIGVSGGATPYADAFYAANGCTYVVSGFTVSSQETFGLHTAYGGHIVIGPGMVFGTVPPGFAQIYSEFDGIMEGGSSYEINGSGTWHMLAEDGGKILHYSGTPQIVTILGGNFAQAFVRADNLGYIRDFNFSYVGNLGATPCQAMGNGVVNTQGIKPYGPNCAIGTGGMYR